MTPITPVKSLVASAKREIKVRIPPHAFEKQQAGIATLIDVHDIHELQREGRVAGAFHAPRGKLEFWADPQSPYHKKIFALSNKFILFCASSWRSALATKALQDIGMKNIYDIDGDFDAWRLAGLPVANSEPSK